MLLSPNDAELFYDLLIPLARYANTRYKIEPDAPDSDNPDAYPLEVIMSITDYVWSNTKVIDQFLKTADLPDEHKLILTGWKRCLPGTYVIERHLKRGSVFISSDSSVYMVSGIMTPYSEMLPPGHLPATVRTVLLPFRGIIITSGLLSEYPVKLGAGYRGFFKDLYLDAKANGKIIHSI